MTFALVSTTPFFGAVLSLAACSVPRLTACVSWYGMLRYEGEPLPTLYSLDGGEYVIYLGTFSKILSPGLRLGWTAAPRPVLEKMNLGKGSVDLCPSSLSQHFVVAYFAERDWLEHVEKLGELLRRRASRCASSRSCSRCSTR